VNLRPALSLRATHTMRVVPALLLLLIGAGAAGAPHLFLSPAAPAVDVFVAGQGAAAQYRIPALSRTAAGTLVAFAEARTDPATDCGYKWLVARRSTDGGATWGPPIDVVGREWTGWATGNAQPFFHAASGRLVVVVGTKDLSAPGRYCEPGSAVFAVDDGGSDGVRWGPARNISSSLAGVAGGATLLPGPGTGLVLARGPHAGRLLAVGLAGGAYSSEAVFWSDNGGLDWTVSATKVGPGMDEANMAELSDGTVYLSMRNAHANASCDCVAYALSTDGGESFGPIQFDPTLVSPECEAAVAGYNGALYFSNTADTRVRANITVRRTAPGVRVTDPTAWVSSHLVASGPTWGGYSSLAPTPLSADLGGILFERNITDNTPEGCVISFSTFPLVF